MASIQKRDNGSWRVRWRDGAGKEHARHFKRQYQAKRFRDELTTSVVTGMYVDPRAGDTTFQAFFEEWSARQDWADGTRTAAARAVKSTTFADLPIGKITPEHVEEWMKAMTLPAASRKDGLAPTTRKMRLNYVQMTFAAAVRGRRISTSPAVGLRVKMPRKATDADDLDIPTAGQVAAVMGEADVMFRGFVAVCAFAGLRLGEAAGLQVADVDFDRYRLRVQRQVQGATNSTTTIVPPKGGAVRTVYVPEALTVLLGRQVEEVGTRDGYVFSNGGHLFNRQSAGHRWREAAKAAGVEGFTLHSLRHFYASGLIRAGCDVVTVQRALGHSQPSITLDVYSSLWPDAEDRTRDAAAAMMSAADPLRTGGATAP